MMLLQLPKILEPFRDKIESTFQHTVRIHPQAKAPTYLWQSKIGGKPYWPKNREYPVSAEGNPLFFLAQLNFAEIPALEDFPSKGLLQFFIADNEWYGLEPNNPGQANQYQVIYHANPILEVSALEDNFDFLPEFEHTPLAPDASFALEFTLEKEWLGPPDYRFYEEFPESFLAQFGEEEEEVMDFFYELGSKSSGHKIGGYAFFTQSDPRDAAKPMYLLFQIDSDNDIDSLWGDMGIANFFIAPEALKMLSFDRVLYNWDCS